MKKFHSLAISKPSDLIFGKSVFPVECGNNLIIGDGMVYPEINFTLPTININESTWKQVKNHYREIVSNIAKRACALGSDGFVAEFEQLPPMTENPEWGAEITALLKKELDSLYNNAGIKNALRVTVVDLRDAERPPLLRYGRSWEKTQNAFNLAAQAGADILSIESVGGKEVHDQALMYADIKGIVASLGILACKDVAWLWKQISEICARHKCIPGGDTACGFGNTAMQLAGQGMLPDILAALVRAASAPRSLAAYENGAIGPSKDCAYEGPIIKAITGFPISMEGKSSCCAHFSPLGNIAGAAADLWSNESVQNVRLLSGNAPEAFYELLQYDCRLFNTALNEGKALDLRNLLVKSDLEYNVQALMLEPSAVIKIAEAIVKQDNGYSQTVAAIRRAFDLISVSMKEGITKLKGIEMSWMDKIASELDELPANENDALDYLVATYPGLFVKSAYGLFHGELENA